MIAGQHLLTWIWNLIFGDIVSHVEPWTFIEWRYPHSVNTQSIEMIQLGVYAWQVSPSVGVGIAKAGWALLWIRTNKACERVDKSFSQYLVNASLFAMLADQRSVEGSTRVERETSLTDFHHGRPLTKAQVLVAAEAPCPLLTA